MILRERGFSLIEMLIAMIIAIIMVVVMYSFFTTQHRSYTIQDNVADMQQNVRMAMLTLSRNVRMAGYGVPTSCAMAPANSSSGSDGIFVSDADAIRTLPDSQIFFAELNGDVSAGASSITVTTTDIDDDGNPDFSAGGALIISDGTNTDGLIISSGYTGSNAIPLDSVLQNGYIMSTARVVPALSYSVANEDLLQDSQPLAFHIEDLQVSYQDRDGTWYCHDVGSTSPPTDTGSIRVVEINVLARTKVEDARETSFSQPSVADHIVSNPPMNGFRRRLLTTRIHVRNLVRP